jgi:16S rRNA (guanine966-N2)-methyltransferase
MRAWVARRGGAGRMSENGAHGNTRPTHARMNKPTTSGRRSAPAAAVAGNVRIIGGRWRGTRLQVPRKPGLRPTADRVRETLFNWLMPVLAGAKVLDLFAGSGALGLEAVSRGAASARLVEADPQLAQALQATASRLDAGGQVRVHRGDALAWLRCGEETGFDIAFVDPPFDANLWPAVLELLPARMAADAWLYLETPAALAPELPPEWALHRESGTREVRYALYRRATLPAVNHVGDPATL